MPELPEVETVVCGLKNHIVNKSIVGAKVSEKKLRAMYPANFEECVSGGIVQNIWRRAKYIILTLHNGYSIIFHLGMSGKLLYKQLVAEKKHVHVVIYFSDGSVLQFEDPRRFGLVDVCISANMCQYRLFANLGPEPLSEEFSISYIMQYVKGKNVSVKNLLMNSNFVVGIGNIYASEVLYEAKINPLRKAFTLTKQEVICLHNAILEVLNCAIKAGGSTLKDYVNADGDVGNYQHQFRVYGRGEKECYRCGDYIMKEVQAGRATYYCIGCQK